MTKNQRHSYVRTLKAASMMKYALTYAELGLPVIPMKLKRPLIKGGVNAASTDPKQIKAWWTQFPDADIGIAPGSASGIIVLDIDPRNGGDETMARLEKELGPLPATAKVRTGGGGYHLLVAAPEFPVKKDTLGKIFGPGVDLLSEGSIAVVPPSIHGSGKLYRHVKGRNLLKGAKPKKLPKLWCERLRSGHKSSPEVTKAIPDSYSPIMEGRRNTTLTKIGGYLVTTGLTPEAVLQCLMQVNERRCGPPLAGDEVKEIADSVERYRPEKVSTFDTPEYIAFAMAMAEHFAGGRHLRSIPKHGLHVYDGRKWMIEDEAAVSKLVLSTIERLPPGKQKVLSLLSDVMRLATIKQTADADLFYSDAQECVLNLANGELGIADDGTVTFKAHSPESNLMHCLQVSYDPTAKCAEYDRALLQIFAEAEDPADMVRHWNEVAGYLIQTVRDIPLILMLLGKGSNGKTALWMTLRKLIGDGNIYSGSLGQIESDRFMIGFLRGKVLFVDDDIKAGQKLPDGALKKISEDKLLSGQLKGRDAFQFTNKALPVLLCNNEPTTSDLSKGMQRRIMVIPFKHEFEVGKDLDRNLWKRIRRNEMSGILNRLIEGLQRLRKRGDFKPPVDVRRAKRDWFRDANPLKGFLAERTKRKNGSRVLVSELYSAYAVWADENGIKFHLQRNTLKRQLEQLGYNVRPSNRGIVVIGLRLRHD